MPIGLAPFTIRHHIFDKPTVESAYAKLKALGFDGLENGIGGAAGFNIDEDKAVIAKHDLKICSIWGNVENPDEAIKTAEAHGVTSVCVTVIPPDMLRSAEGFRGYARWLNEKSKPFAKAGLKICHHNHAQEFRNFAELGGKSGMEILINETDPDGVEFLFDTFWATAAGADPAFWIRRLGKRSSKVVHFKDYAIDDLSYDTGLEKIPFRFAEVGQGNINWVEVLAACKEIGIEWYCIEQDLHRGDAFDSLKTSIEFMRNELKIV